VTGNITLYAKWTAEGGGTTDPEGTFTSIAALKTWLDAQPDTYATPYRIALKGVNLDAENNWGDLGLAIGSKSVELDLTGCTGTTIPDGYRERIPGPAQVVQYRTYGAFVDCDNLKAVKLPPTVKTIGDYAFFECNMLNSVTLPDGLTSINYGAFSSCGLTSIALPDGLKKIGDYAFESCRLTSVNIPESVTELGKSVFYFCLSLRSAKLNAGVKEIGYGVFYQCQALESVEIPESVTSIGSSAFLSCEALQSVTIPSRVALIGDNAFHDCKALAEVVVLAATPPVLEDFAFRNTATSLAVKVPAASLDAYKTAAGWSAYADRIVAN
jgi:hypothetical protein